MEGLHKDALLKLVSYFHNPELVGSLLLAYVIHMVSLTVNIPHSFLNGLRVIIAPTEEAVLRLRPDTKGPRPKALRQKEKEGKEPDAYDKMNALGLVRMEISRGTLGTLVYFPAYEGMVLWALVSLGNFLVAQISRCALPARRPMGWATLTLCGALVRAMWCNVRLVALLGWDNDHSKFAVLSGFCGFFLAAGVGAMFPPGFFAFDLAAAASGFRWWCAQVTALAWTRGGDSTSPASASSGGLSGEDFMALFVLGTAITAACVTASAALPSIRFAQFYQRALRRGSGASLFYRALLVVDLVLPWVATLVWIRPFPSLVLGERRADAWGHLLRLGALGGAILARLLVGKAQLQAFLDGAQDAVLQDLREKKVNPTAVRTKFEARLQYLVIAAAQYAAPALTTVLALALFLQEGDDTSPSHRPAGGPMEGGGGEGHINGRGSAAGDGDDCVRALSTAAVAAGGGICDAARRLVGAGSRREIIAAAAAAATAAAAANASGGPGEDVDSVSPMKTEIGPGGLFVHALTRVPGFPEAFWTGVAGFFAWWACASWAVTYALGVAFWQAFPEDDSVEERGRRDRTTKAKRERVKGKAKASKANINKGKTRVASSN